MLRRHRYRSLEGPTCLGAAAALPVAPKQVGHDVEHDYECRHQHGGEKVNIRHAASWGRWWRRVMEQEAEVETHGYFGTNA